MYSLSIINYRASLFATGMPTRYITWVVSPHLQSLMCLQSAVVDSPVVCSYSSSAPPLRRMGSQEAQLLPTMSHGCDNTTDTTTWQLCQHHCVGIVHSYQHDISILSDPLQAEYLVLFPDLIRCICRFLKAIHTGVGFGSGTKTK